MQVTNSMTNSMLLGNIESSLNSLNTVQQQISTGKQVNLPSDNPAGVAQSLGLRASLADNAQYQKDANSAGDFLAQTDSSLSDATSLVNSAIQIASEGANSSETSDSQAALADQVNNMISELTNIANSQYNGKYIFGGTQTTTAPFPDPSVDPTNTYQGNSGSVTATIGPTNNMTLNVSGSQVFSGLFTTLNNLKANLTSGNIDAISSNITDLQNNLSTISTAQATVGAKQDEVTTVQSQLTRAEGDYQQSISNIEDVDLAQAYVQQQTAQNVYQASLVTTQDAFKYSLADYLQ